MAHGPVRAGHVPAAPAIGERHAIVDIVRAAERRTIRRRERAPEQHARDIQRTRDVVTGQAVRSPFQPRVGLRLLLDGVEDNALPGILYGKLKKRRAGDVADRDRVVEEDGARIRGAGIERLNARSSTSRASAIPRARAAREHRSQVAGRAVEGQM